MSIVTTERVDYHEALANAMRQQLAMVGATRRGMVWSCAEHIALEVGERYEPSPLPKRFTMGTPKRCFDNSFHRACRHKGLVYVEGFALVDFWGFPIHHAWLVRNGSKDVIEVTSTDFVAYHGLPFRTEYVREQRRRARMDITMLDGWCRKWPLWRLSRAEIETCLQR